MLFYGAEHNTLIEYTPPKLNFLRCIRKSSQEWFSRFIFSLMTQSDDARLHFPTVDITAPMTRSSESHRTSLIRFWPPQKKYFPFLSSFLLRCNIIFITIKYFLHIFQYHFCHAKQAHMYSCKVHSYIVVYVYSFIWFYIMAFYDILFNNILWPFMTVFL